MTASDRPATAVIRAEPDGYDMGKKALMGRQSAGHGFLRAAVQGRGDGIIHGLTANRQAATAFQAIVRDIDPAAGFQWIHPDESAKLGDVGVLYLADAAVASHARLRQRVGLAAYSLCGVTHTTASTNAMDEIAGLLRDPVAPWDALVCTSSSVIETVRRVHEAEADYLRWRLGPEVRIQPPQLPLIPLGVHCQDFAFGDAARANARAKLGLDDDEVAALFVGRLVFHAKAHPFPMYVGLQEAARRSGKRLVLILSGWAPNEQIADAFRSGAARFAPDVRLMMVEGRDAALRAAAWAGADIFMSLSDNIQETFGLTPIEAMAAGLPVVVTDWDGYRDTVRHGVDGFRIRTWAPAPGMGQPLARGLETNALNYDRYCWGAASTTAVDIAQLSEVLTTLVEDPGLRRRLGEAGRQRARELYDWAVIYRQYQDLWADLNARRRAAHDDPATAAWLGAAPRAPAARLDPYDAFGHYPTAVLDPQTRVALAPGATAEALNQVASHRFFSELITPRTQLDALFAVLADGDKTIAEATMALGSNTPSVTRAAGTLAKLGLAVFR